MPSIIGDLNKMKVIEYIQNNGLEALKENKAIKVREYDDRIVLNYNQIDSPKFDKTTQECRGLILSWPNLDILSRSFDRFFNYGEGSTPKKIKDWSGYIGYEKLDGSLINFYWDGRNHCAATRGMAFAEGNTTFGDDKTFKDIIEIAAGCSIEEFCTDNLLLSTKENTHIFELVSPETRVVKPYNDYELYLLAIRNKFTGEYAKPEILEEQIQYASRKTLAPKIYSFNTIEDCVKSSTEMDSPFDEGYVLWNPNTNHRLKVKNPAYVAIAHMRQDGVLSEKRIVLLIFKNDQAEYLNLFPEDQKFFDPYIEAYGKLITEVNNVWEDAKEIEDQKDFAMQVKDTRVKTFMFNLRKGVSIGATIERMTDNTKLELLKQFKG